MEYNLVLIAIFITYGDFCKVVVVDVAVFVVVVAKNIAIGISVEVLVGAVTVVVFIVPIDVTDDVWGGCFVGRVGIVVDGGGGRRNSTRSSGFEVSGGGGFGAGGLKCTGVCVLSPDGVVGRIKFN